jgi:hypothetical protein
VPISRKRGSVIHAPHTSSWRSAGLVKHRERWPSVQLKHRKIKTKAITQLTPLHARNDLEEVTAPEVID